jgi:hypothetical protein
MPVPVLTIGLLETVKSHIELGFLSLFGRFLTTIVTYKYIFAIGIAELESGQKSLLIIHPILPQLIVCKCFYRRD